MHMERNSVRKLTSKAKYFQLILYADPAQCDHIARALRAKMYDSGGKRLLEFDRTTEHKDVKTLKFSVELGNLKRSANKKQKLEIRFHNLRTHWGTNWPHMKHVWLKIVVDDSTNKVVVLKITYDWEEHNEKKRKSSQAQRGKQKMLLEQQSHYALPNQPPLLPCQPPLSQDHEIRKLQKQVEWLMKEMHNLKQKVHLLESSGAVPSATHDTSGQYHS